jgi:hypothetical protein
MKKILETSVETPVSEESSKKSTLLIQYSMKCETNEKREKIILHHF